jgi:hypothetical protein
MSDTAKLAEHEQPQVGKLCEQALARSVDEGRNPFDRQGHVVDR